MERNQDEWLNILYCEYEDPSLKSFKDSEKALGESIISCEEA
jgi:hypothetical protein